MPASAGEDPCVRRGGWFSRVSGRYPLKASTAELLRPGEARPFTTSVETLESDYPARILPFFHSGKEGFFSGEGGVPIHFRSWQVPNSKGTVLLLHGASDSMATWPENIFNLAEAGYNVYMLDHRGHGQSGRLAKDPQIVHVDQFENYVRDVKTFVDTVVKPDGHAKVHLIGTSAGGTIAAKYAEDHPEDVSKVVLAAPMLKIIFPMRLPGPVVQAVASGAVLTGNGASYAPFQGPPNPDFWKAMQPSRGKVITQMRAEAMPPETLLGGMSYQWLQQAVQASREASRNGGKVQSPVLILQAGDETLVRNTEMDRFARSVPDAAVRLYPGVDHGILTGNDTTRDVIFRDILQFLENGNPPSGQ